MRLLQLLPVLANNGRTCEAWPLQAETRPPFSYWLITLQPATFFFLILIVLPAPPPPPPLDDFPLPPLSRVCMLLTCRRGSACSELFVQVVCSQSNSCRPIKLIPPALRLPIEGAQGRVPLHPPSMGTRTMGWHCASSGWGRWGGATPALNTVQPPQCPPPHPPPRSSSLSSPCTQMM